MFFRESAFFMKNIHGKFAFSYRLSGERSNVKEVTPVTKIVISCMWMNTIMKVVVNVHLIENT